MFGSSSVAMKILPRHQQIFWSKSAAILHCAPTLCRGTRPRPPRHFSPGQTTRELSSPVNHPLLMFYQVLSPASGSAPVTLLRDVRAPPLFFVFPCVRFPSSSYPNNLGTDQRRGNPWEFPLVPMGIPMDSHGNLHGFQWQPEAITMDSRRYPRPPAAEV